jgi:uncharacterized membrane protein
MLGGIGSILTLLLFVPYFVGTGLVIIGWILTIVAIKQISDALQDKTIFNNAIIAMVLAIVGVVIFGILAASAVLAFIGLGNLSQMGTPPMTSDFVGLITGIIAGLAVVWILGIVGSIFLRRSYTTISAKLKVGLFGTGALLYLIGAVLTIFFVGFFLIFIAQILFIIAFFSIPENVPAASPQPQQMRP